MREETRARVRASSGSIARHWRRFQRGFGEAGARNRKSKIGWAFSQRAGSGKRFTCRARERKVQWLRVRDMINDTA